MNAIKIENNIVTQVLLDVPCIPEGYIQNDVAKLNQVLQPDGTFITPVIEQNTEATFEDKINYLYYKSMGVI